MNNLFAVAIVLFSISVVSLVVSLATQGPLHSYAHLIFYVTLAAGGLITLFYFLITRRGKDRPI